MKTKDRISEAIVVGTDGSRTAQLAVDEAIRVARALGAELHIVTVYGMRASPMVANAPDVAALMMAALPGTEAESIVEEAAATPRGDGLTVLTHAVEGDPGDALIEVASRVGARMIVVGNRGMSGPRRLLGSVPNRVSHAAPCNVMIVSTGERRGR